MAGSATVRAALAQVALGATGALLARVALRVTHGMAGSRLDRTNFHGRTVTLAAGPALAVAASVSAAAGAGGPVRAAAALTAGLGAGTVGLYDDLAGAAPGHQAAKGFRGHLGALRAGHVTSGVVKIAGVGAAALAGAALLAADDRRPPRRRPARRVTRAADLLCGAGVIAGTANLVNLLDLRPGRALKAALLIGSRLPGAPSAGLVAGPLGAAGALLPDDLDETVMLGDGGANALGALLGLGLAARTGPLGRAGLLLGLAGLTAASEKISFTKVIESTPGLRAVDGWGRRAG